MRHRRMISIMILMTIVNIGLIMIRHHEVGSPYHFRGVNIPNHSFLLWNLFLAWIPLCLSVTLKKSQRWFIHYPIVIMWLLFFPNAGYIVTDLVHLKERAGMPYWFDIIMYFSFAVNGLLVGVHSMRIVLEALKIPDKKYIKPTLTFLILILCGIGIYVGRFWRWNSWYVLTEPMTLFHDVVTMATDKQLLLHFVGFSLLFSIPNIFSFLILSSEKK